MANTELTAKRAKLNETVFNSYSPDNFPGSKAWRVTFAAQAALNEFDAAHPEINTDIEACREAKNAATAKEAGWI